MNSVTTTPVYEEAPSHPHAIAETPHGGGLIAVGAISCLIVALQQTLVVPATPQLPRLLNTTPELVSWLVTATLLTGALTTPLFGRLSDLLGKRRMLIVSMTFVLAGSVVAPLGGIGTLIAGRALQGVGTALVPVAMAQMRESLPHHRVGTALAIMSAMLGVGGAVGIPLGGVMLQSLGWTSMFWLSALLAVGSLVLIALFVPPNIKEDSGEFDWTGTVLLSVGLLALLVALSQSTSWGWDNPNTYTSLAVGIIVLAAWAVFERKHPSPLVDVQTFITQVLLFTNLASLTLGIMMFSNLLLTTRRLQNPETAGGFSWDAASAGLAMLPTAAVMFLVAPLSAWMAQRFSARIVLIIGAIIAGLGYILATFAALSPTATITWTTIISAGVGIGYAALPMLIVQHAPLREIGSANGVNALLRAVGTAIASAMVGAITAGLLPGATSLTIIGAIGGAVSVITIFFGIAARSAGRS